MKLLIIEDDVALAQGIAMVLEEEGYEPLIASSLKKGKEILERESIKLVILDINLPDGSGLEFCRVHRKELSMPVLMLTAKDTEEDEILGFEAGADDYVTKPFRIGILRARVHSLIRRNQNPKVFVFDSLHLDLEKRVYMRDGKELALSKVEQELLSMLLINQGQTLTRNQLINQIWDNWDSVDENTLTVTVGRLRNKLGGNYIKTIYGIGYRWQQEETS
ncbi:MAG: response regulator transcription factor [Lachnospiraceae bacterium]|nr:response regulator transcription factor [Lachnospiraceae bacterium]